MEQIKKPENRFEKLGRSARKIATALGIFAIASGPLFSKNDIKNENLNTDKTELTEEEKTQEYFELSKKIGFVGFDDFNFDDNSGFENVDTLKKDKYFEHGYKLVGQKKMVGKLRNYYEPIDSKTKKIEAPKGCKFNIQKTREELNKIGTKDLGELYFVFDENGKALFYNFDLKGKAHICELDGGVEVFVVNGEAYAVACGNLLMPVPIEEVKVEEVVKEKEKEVEEVVETKKTEKRKPVMATSYKAGGSYKTSGSNKVGGSYYTTGGYRVPGSYVAGARPVGIKIFLNVDQISFENKTFKGEEAFMALARDNGIVLSRNEIKEVYDVYKNNLFAFFSENPKYKIENTWDEIRAMRASKYIQNYSKNNLMSMYILKIRELGGGEIYQMTVQDYMALGLLRIKALGRLNNIKL